MELSEKNKGLLYWLLLIALIVNCISNGIIGVVVMSELGDVRVENATYHNYEVEIAEINKDEIIGAIEDANE